MKTAEQMLKQVESLDIMQIARASVKKTLPALEQANRDQLLNGQNANETKITPYYKPTTLAIKRQKNQETRFVTLKDTGSFHQKIKATLQGDEYNMTSGDWKTEKLEEKYGEKILGVGGVHKRSYVEGPLNEATFNELENHFK